MKKEILFLAIVSWQVCLSVSQSVSPPHWSRLKYLNNNHLTIYYCCSKFVQCSPTMILYCSLISSLSLLGSEADGFQWFSRSLCQAAPAAGSLQGLDLLSQHGFVPAFIYLFIYFNFKSMFYSSYSISYL